MKNKKTGGFTIVELVIVIAVIAILATVLVPTFSEMIIKAKDTAAIQDAKNAYKEYIIEALKDGAQGEYFLYEADEDRVVALRGGENVGVYESRAVALKSILDSPDTVADESLGYGLVATSIEGFYAVSEKEGASWNGASAVFVGDSITAGVGTDKAYHSYIKEMHIFGSVISMGVAGSCISATSDYGTGNSPLIKRYSSIPDADLIVIFMGTNDYGHETPLGSIDDKSDVSFYGALNVIIPAILDAHPDGQLVFITPLHRYGFGTSKITGEKFTYDSVPNGRGHNLEDYVNALRTVCGKYGVSVIDLFENCRINPENSADKTAYFPDGLHPNTAGHKIVADTIWESLQLIPNKNGGSGGGISDKDEQECDFIHGNKFAPSYNSDTTRASLVKNIYLEKGETVTFKCADRYKWALAKTESEDSVTYSRYYPENTWNTVTSYTVAESGYYGFVMAKNSGEFDFEGDDPINISDYISIE